MGYRDRPTSAADELEGATRTVSFAKVTAIADGVQQRRVFPDVAEALVPKVSCRIWQEHARRERSVHADACSQLARPAA